MHQAISYFRVLHDLYTAWKVFVFGVFLVRIFLHSDWIRRYTSYFSVFSLNAGKYGQEKLRIRTIFTQWSSTYLHYVSPLNLASFLLALLLLLSLISLARRLLKTNYQFIMLEIRFKIIRVRGGSRAAATSKMECFLIIANGWKPLAIIAKRSILDVAAGLEPLLRLNLITFPI